MDDKICLYNKIYQQLYEGPFSPVEEIASALHMSALKVTRSIDSMYQSSLMQGPVVSVKPAPDYHMYSYFLRVDDPCGQYKNPFKKSDISKSWTAGAWNLMVITNEKVDFTKMEGVRECVHSGKKGGTYISQCIHTDWDYSLEYISSRIESPSEETVFYEETPSLNWGEKEWLLYYAFRINARQDPAPILRNLDINQQAHKEWISTLPSVAYVQPAFYPHGWDTCSALDFLLSSYYQRQVVDILGVLPCSGIFFSAGDSLLARLFIQGPEERKRVDTIILYLRKCGYITDFVTTLVLSTRHKGDFQNLNSDTGKRKTAGTHNTSSSL
ncbi:MAG: hypothetical protein HXS41_01915 [Theionarchaea archaeon]|nr:hypothetical protein [Theionarchaea archaeon]MBU7019786.1 hypothetical protein [Theionarchaea archaeon]